MRRTTSMAQVFALCEAQGVAEAAASNRVLRFVRLASYDNPEFFLVERDGAFYVLRYAAGSGLSFGILVRGTDRAAVGREFDLAVENEERQTGVGSRTGAGVGGGLAVAAIHPDDEALHHLRIFDNPRFGVRWATDGRAVGGEVDVDRHMVEQFHALLAQQLRSWKGVATTIDAAKHRYWPTFHDMVQQAVRQRYGARFTLYRGIRGAQAEQVLAGAALAVRPYSSWTPSRRMARTFRGAPGDAWAVVAAEFTPAEVALAPVRLPAYAPDPDLLLRLANDVQASGVELVVFVPAGRLVAQDLTIVASGGARKGALERQEYDMRDTMLEGISKKVGPDKWKYKGQTGHWRTVRGSEVFFPDGGGKPLGVPKKLNWFQRVIKKLRGEGVEVTMAHAFALCEEELGEWSGGRRQFQDPGGKSALRKATSGSPRVYPCPNCKQPNKLTAQDVKRGYQCDDCADLEEGPMAEANAMERYLTLPRGWGSADGLRFKKDQEAWRQAQFALITKAKRLAALVLRDAEPGDTDVFAQGDEANPTGIAELVAHELDHDEWLDDETHWIWDIAMEAATQWNKGRGWR